MVPSVAMRARPPLVAVTLGLAFDRAAFGTFLSQFAKAPRPWASGGDRRVHRLAAVLLLPVAITIAWAQSQVYPLEPVDRSSPRATLQTFLDSADAVATYMAHDYLPSPSRAKFNRAIELIAIPVESLDLSALPPATRLKGGRAAALALYEVLNRIQLPPADQIPDVNRLAQAVDGGALRWVIPHTEITLVRVPSGPRSGEFLFSADTVARASSFYERVRNQPYSRPVPIANVRELFISGGGWLIPYRWINAMPAWLRQPLSDQPLWKWIGFVFESSAYRWLRRFRLCRRIGRSRQPERGGQQTDSTRR